MRAERQSLRCSARNHADGPGLAGGSLWSHRPERSWPLALLRRLANPLVAILVLASAASVILHDFGNAAAVSVHPSKPLPPMNSRRIDVGGT
jgi:hypothetical protein